MIGKRKCIPIAIHCHRYWPTNRFVFLDYYNWRVIFLLVVSTICCFLIIQKGRLIEIALWYFWDGLKPTIHLLFFFPTMRHGEHVWFYCLIDSCTINYQEIELEKIVIFVCMKLRWGWLQVGRQRTKNKHIHHSIVKHGNAKSLLNRSWCCNGKRIWGWGFSIATFDYERVWEHDKYSI